MGKQNLNSFSATDPTDDLITLNATHGAFPGSAVQSHNIERIIAAHIPRQHIKDVSAVYETKWWDYRRMQPGHSFMLFAHCYYRAFRIAARKMLSHKQRDQSKVALIGVGALQFKADEIWDRDKGHITGMWKSMLVCDALGMPYDWFNRLGCDIAVETAWQRLPRPSQLYSDKMGGQILDRWIAVCDERMFVSSHPVYLVENYAGTPLQDEYRAWLVGRIKTRQNPVPALAQALYMRPQLEERDVLGEFPKQAISRAKLLAS